MGAKNITEDNIVHGYKGNVISVGAEISGFVTENIIVRRNTIWITRLEHQYWSRNNQGTTNSRIVHNTVAAITQTEANLVSTVEQEIFLKIIFLMGSSTQYQSLHSISKSSNYTLI
jgi:phage replication-related protein YjqB (UPF0714/DUF867 family)